MTRAAPAVGCSECGRRIGAKATHYLALEADPPVILCGRCLNAMRGTRHLHRKHYPACPDTWHDMHDHPLMFCTRAAVPFALNRGAR